MKATTLKKAYPPLKPTIEKTSLRGWKRKIWDIPPNMKAGFIIGGVSIGIWAGKGGACLVQAIGPKKKK